MSTVFQAAVEVEAFCAARGWKHCFIGGIAVQRWGKPRVTMDVDLTLLTGFGGEEKFIDSFLRAFPGRQPNSAKAALTSRVVLAKSSNGTEVDMSLGGLPFEEASVGRATRWSFRPGASITTCSAEDLIVHKVFAGRGIDWTDVERVLIRRLPKLNLRQIRDDLLPLLELKEDEETYPKFEKLLLKVERLRKR
jgi:hypothetical protein